MYFKLLLISSFEWVPRAGSHEAVSVIVIDSHFLLSLHFWILTLFSKMVLVDLKIPLVQVGFQEVRNLLHIPDRFTVVVDRTIIIWLDAIIVWLHVRGFLIPVVWLVRFLVPVVCSGDRKSYYLLDVNVLHVDVHVSGALLFHQLFLCLSKCFI